MKQIEYAEVEGGGGGGGGGGGLSVEDEWQLAGLLLQDGNEWDDTW